MRDSVSSTDSTEIGAELSGIQRAELAAALRYDLTSYNGPSICFGIMLAGAAYPVVIAAIFVVCFLGFVMVNLHQILRGTDIIELAATPFFVAGYAAFGAMLGLRHMMWLIVWLSLLLSVIRLSGIPFKYVVPLLAGWLLYQWLTLRVGGLLVTNLGPRWIAWRSRRST
jgi:hypothetical protein